MMQELVGIVRVEEEMTRALDEHRRAAQEGATTSRVKGNREYNPGWHTALDLHNLLTVSEAVTRAALLRKESRGGHFRDDFRGARATSGRRRTSSSRRAATAQMQIATAPIPPRCRAELKRDHRGEKK